MELTGELELEQALANENAAWASGRFDSNIETGEPANTYITRQIILLQQERDMRSSEVHYIDHPILGVIIKITPYTAEIAPSIPQT